jgi:hypothetical protein
VADWLASRLRGRLQPPLASIRAIARTTTFRVAASIAGLFTLFAMLLLASLYFTTAGRLNFEATEAARREIEELADVWRGQGVAGLNRVVIEKSSRVGAPLYVLIDPAGMVVSGNIDTVPIDLSRVRRPDAGSILNPRNVVESAFTYARPDFDTGEIRQRRARGLFLPGSDGYGIFVAVDLGDDMGLADQVARVIWVSAAAVIGFALVGGYFAARQAAGRVDELSQTTRAVMGGDLARRARVRPLRPDDGDEFDQLASDLNSMLDRIERLVSSSRSIGDAVAHDLRSPLTRLRARLEDAAVSAGTLDDLRASVEDATAELDAVVATFNAVLRLSRLEAGEGGRFAEVDLAAMMTDVADLYEPSLADVGMRLRTEIMDTVIAQADGSLIMQAMTNLLDNTIKYARAGEVVLGCRSLPGGLAELSVTDSGPGIAPQDRARALERFGRLDSARSSAGTGLGLALAVAVADAHGGRLELADGVPPVQGLREPMPGLRVALIVPTQQG